MTFRFRSGSGKFPSLIGRLTREAVSEELDGLLEFPSLIGRLTSLCVWKGLGVEVGFHPS